MTADSLLAHGLAELDDRDWDQAAEALGQFTFRYPTHPRYQEARYRLGEAFFGKGEFITAASEFNRLASDYPAGPYADDARFRVCESYERLSPKPQLDQEYTVAAIEHCQSLIAYFPDSPFAERGREIIAASRDKLAEKAFDAGEYYYKIRAYDSAVKYYDELLENFSDTSAAPRALLRLYESYQQLGYSDEAAEARERLLREFPESEAARRLAGVSVNGGS